MLNTKLMKRDLVDIKDITKGVFHGLLPFIIAIFLYSLVLVPAYFIGGLHLASIVNIILVVTYISAMGGFFVYQRYLKSG